MSDENILDPMATVADDTQEEVIEEGNIDETTESVEEIEEVADEMTEGETSEGDEDEDEE